MSLSAENAAAVPAGRIDEITEHRRRICRRVLEDLPDWFGIPRALRKVGPASMLLKMKYAVGVLALRSA